MEKREVTNCNSCPFFDREGFICQGAAAGIRTIYDDPRDPRSVVCSGLVPC